MSQAYKVTVIVPIYKVESFIERCVRTLMTQTLSEIEYVFVDDASPDRSVQILKDVILCYPERKKNVRIIHHDVNKGLPAARNTGLSVAKGEYIFHCDSDDYADSTMLEDLYEAAVSNKSDIVWCDWYLTYTNKERYMSQPRFSSPIDAISAMLGGGMKFNVWNKLVRRSLYIDYNITFPAGYGMGEDMTMIMLFAHASSITYIPKAYYHYVKTNTNAFSQTYSDKHLMELEFNVKRISEYINMIYGYELEAELNFLRLEVKFPFLLTNNFKRWEEWYPESNKFIVMNKYISARSRLVQWLAYRKQYWLVWIYNQLLNKVIYGVIFK